MLVDGETPERAQLDAMVEWINRRLTVVDIHTDREAAEIVLRFSRAVAEFIKGTGPAPEIPPNGHPDV